MRYINKIIIQGYKKFTNIVVEFNKSKNILVGENEAGKSTILEAISLVLNQDNRSKDKYIIMEMFNIDCVNNFKENPSFDNLPKIQIAIDFVIDELGMDDSTFYGENHLGVNKTAKNGILFECKIDDEYRNVLASYIEKAEIPVDYYNFSWTTYSGSAYKINRKPIRTLLINTSNLDSKNYFNYYNKALFNSQYEDEIIVKAKTDLRVKIDTIFNELKLEPIDEYRDFGINQKKVLLEDIITVYDKGISIEMKGSGMENLIKTEIVLNREKNKIDLVLIEEPENHLSHGNLLKMIDKIENQDDESQLIITTHNDLIASRLNLKNVIWISNDFSKRLNDINDQTANFFLKSDNNNFLQFLLSKKIILVEGATEFMLLPEIYPIITSNSLEQDAITIISCRSLSYNRYLDLNVAANKKIAIITDNDKNETKIETMKKFNGNHENVHLFMDDSVENWTWETCFYNLNSKVLEGKVNPKSDSDYLFNGQNYGKVLGKMLNNKVETAYQMTDYVDNLTIPEYIKDAIKWIKL